MKFIQPIHSFPMQNPLIPSVFDNQIPTIVNKTIVSSQPIPYNQPFNQISPLTLNFNPIHDFSLVKINHQLNTPPSISPNPPDVCSKWKNESKRRFFTQNEDILLIKAATQYNEKSWNIIAKCVPGRTPRQCRDRWMNYLKPNLKFDPWTKEEDELLITLVNSYGTHWTKMISDFPGRSTNAIKNRWNWLLKDRVSVVSSPLDKKYFFASTDIYQKNSKKGNLKNSNHKDQSLKKDSEGKDFKKIQKNQKSEFNDNKKIVDHPVNNSTARDSSHINEENLFSLWQESMNW